MERLERRVSWMPGAEGAPLDCWEGLETVVLVVEVEWFEGGAIRRDW